MPISVRDARASDAAFLARISLIASRAHVGWGLYDVVLRRPDEEILPVLEALAVTRVPFFHHYTRRLVAEVDGMPAGAIAGFVNDEPFRQTFVPALVEALGPDGLVEVAERRVPWLTCAIPSPEGAWTIELVATLPEFRGAGVGSRLLEASLDAGRAAGCGTGAITFEIGNEPALGAYRSAGFSVAAERRNAAFERTFRVPGLIQVTREL